MPSEENLLKLTSSVQEMIKGDPDRELDLRSLAEPVLYDLRRRRGLNPRVTPEQPSTDPLSREGEG